MKFLTFFSCLLIVAISLSCSPKIQVVNTTDINHAADTLPKVEKPKGFCATFDQSDNPQEALRNFVLYRDFLKETDWSQAYAYWEKVYEQAPAADGKRNTVLADGIRFYEHFLELEKDSLKKEEWIKKIFALYDRIEDCYPAGGYVPARKGFDLYFTYQNRASKKEIYDLFKRAWDIDGEEVPDFVLNPFTSLLVDLYFTNEISIDEARKYAMALSNRLKKGLAECEGSSCMRWKVIEEYLPLKMEVFETVKGFYDCAYFMDKYYPQFLSASDDCEVIREVYSRLKFAGCSDVEEKFAALIKKGNEKCAPEKGPAELAFICLRDADYPCAIEGFLKASREVEDVKKKGEFILLAAKVYYVHMKNFTKARQLALEAAAARPNWGEPFILIGRMYASSGPLCGPGRGWESQVVVWVAIDAWAKAKSIDPSFSSEANKMINQYARFMPNREDVFIRGLKTGERFYVGCWIQESTLIRTVD
ncbi:MAG: hypothetical protein KGQ86_08460 [Bacteroidetes bacterium]|nr:hypothetical protein [Bacteroidota bacterium]